MKQVVTIQLNLVKIFRVLLYVGFVLIFMILFNRDFITQGSINIFLFNQFRIKNPEVLLPFFCIFTFFVPYYMQVLQPPEGKKSLSLERISLIIIALSFVEETLVVWGYLGHIASIEQLLPRMRHIVPFICGAGFLAFITALHFIKHKRERAHK